MEEKERRRKDMCVCVCTKMEDEGFKENNKMRSKCRGSFNVLRFQIGVVYLPA